MLVYFKNLICQINAVKIIISDKEFMFSVALVCLSIVLFVSNITQKGINRL